MKNAEFSYICPSLKKFLFDAYSVQGRIDIARALLKGELSYSDKLLEIIYACTLCGGCEVTCRRNRADMEPLSVLYELRFKCVNDRKGPLEPHKNFAKNIDIHNNPYGEPHQARFDWMPADFQNNEEAEIGFFLGCTIPYRLPNVARAAISVLKKLNVKFKVFPKEEICCGSVLYRVGLKSEIDKLMQHNLEMIEKSGIKKLLFLCPGCYETFKSIYPKLGGKLNFEVEHMVEFLTEFVDNNEINFHELSEIVTYHDPCHLGRLSGVYEQPRKIINAIPELKLTEMDRIMDNTWCCGAGGGVKAGFKDFALWSAKERIKEVKATGSKFLITACPFCELNLKDSVKDLKESIEIRDIIELVDKTIKT